MTFDYIMGPLRGKMVVGYFHREDWIDIRDIPKFIRGGSIGAKVQKNGGGENIKYG